MQYSEMSKEELLQLKSELNKKYEDAKAKGLSLICQEVSHQLLSLMFH